MLSGGFKKLWRRSATRQLYLSWDFADVQTDEDGGVRWQRISASSWIEALALCHPEHHNSFATPKRTAVWLSGALARPFWLPAIEGVSSRQELLHIAQAQASELTGVAEACSVWISQDWTHQRGGLAAVIEDSVLHALQAWSQQNRCALLSIRPWWNLALNQHWQRVTQAHHAAEHPPNALVCLQDEQTLMMFGHDLEGQLRQVACYWPRPESEVLQGLIKRQQWALGNSLAADSTAVPVLMGTRTTQPATAVMDTQNCAFTEWNTSAL